MKSGVCFDESIRRQTAGFTLIEIVLVLVLLGILGAVAAYKYFDMQEEAARIKCAYHRSLVVDDLQNRWALAVADSDRRSTIFPTAKTAESQVLEDLKSSTKEALCPSGGEYEVDDNGGGDKDFENGYVFCVKCSLHGDEGTEMEKCKKSSSSDSEEKQDPDKDITVDKAKTLMEYIRDIYSADKGDGPISSINKFFEVAKGDGSAIQSDAKGDYNSYASGHNYGSYKSMTDIVLQALEGEKYVTENIIWRLTSEQEDWVTDREGNKLYRRSAVLTLVVVDKDEATKKADTGRRVNAQKIELKVNFYDNGNVKSFENITESTTKVYIKKTENDKETYLSIQNDWNQPGKW